MANNHIGLLKTLASIFSPSGDEDKMVNYLTRFCKRVDGTIIEKDDFGNLYVTKGKSKTYPCVVAHCDQVPNVFHDNDFVCIENNGALFGFSKSKKRMNNCGWDDKAGIAIALICLQYTDAIKIAFFRQEEFGAIGSEKADMDFFSDVRFVVEPDRKGSTDIISSIGFTEICSKEFLRDTNHSFYGYSETDGLLTDVISLVDNGIGVSCINVSCGYYNPHSNDEVLIYEDWEKCLFFVLNIIESCEDRYEFKSKNSVYGYASFGHALTKEQKEQELSAWIYFLIENDPMISLEDVKSCLFDDIEELNVSDHKIQSIMSTAKQLMYPEK